VWLNWRGYTGFGYVQTLPADLRNNPDYLASDNFVPFAIQQGWYKPDSGPFNVISAYTRERANSDVTAQEARKVEAAVRAAAGKVDVHLLMQQLHMTGRDSSGYGQVAHLRADVHPDLRTLWVAPGPPVTAAFVPWRIGVEAVPVEYRRHRYLTAGEADRSIQKVDQGVEGTDYVNRAVKRLLYLVDEHRDLFLPEVSAALTAFDTRQLAAQPDVERTALVLLKAKEDALAHRYLTEQANMAAGEGMRLIEALADGIEARTRWLHGIRPTESETPPTSQ
jgi:hypothetical protein